MGTLTALAAASPSPSQAAGAACAAQLMTLHPTKRLCGGCWWWIHLLLLGITTVPFYSQFSTHHAAAIVLLPSSLRRPGLWRCCLAAQQSNSSSYAWRQTGRNAQHHRQRAQPDQHSRLQRSQSVKTLLQPIPRCQIYLPKGMGGAGAVARRIRRQHSGGMAAGECFV